MTLLIRAVTHTHTVYTVCLLRAQIKKCYLNIYYLCPLRTQSFIQAYILRCLALTTHPCTVTDRPTTAHGNPEQQYRLSCHILCRKGENPTSFLAHHPANIGSETSVVSICLQAPLSYQRGAVSHQYLVLNPLSSKSCEQEKNTKFESLCTIMIKGVV